MSKRSLLAILQDLYPNNDKSELLAKILCGEVSVNGETIRSATVQVHQSSSISVRSPKRFVSRGGIKLDYAMNMWDVKTSGRIFLDIGASTGGFTDCLLQRGAQYVYSIDVGYNQLSYSLRIQPKVGVFERTNIMSLSIGDLDPHPHAAVMDLSFRSIRKVTSRCLEYLKEGWMIALVKPQFEWKNPSADFRGVITDNDILIEVLIELVEDLRKEKVYVSDIIQSPIRGRKGNREFFIYTTTHPLPRQKNLEDAVNRLVYE